MAFAADRLNRSRSDNIKSFNKTVLARARERQDLVAPHLGHALMADQNTTPANRPDPDETSQKCQAYAPPSFFFASSKLLRNPGPYIPFH
jgi:hypothetical protein